MIAAILPLIKMFFAVTVGALDDHTDIKSVIFLSKGLYFLTGIFFFLAGTEHSIPILLVAVATNAIASAALLTSYESLIRKYASKGSRATSFGLYFSCMNLAYVIGAVIASWMINYVDLPHLFLFISLFAIGSFVTDTQIPQLSKKTIKQFLGKESFVHQFFSEVFSLRAIRRGVSALKQYNKKMYRALGDEVLFNILNYVGFIFIPIISIQNNLNLSQIALIFAVMRLPYVIDVFTGAFADRYNKKKFILLVLFFMSFLYTLLGLRDGFVSILVISLGIAFGLSLLRPAISGLISEYTHPGDDGKITGLQHCVGGLGAALGSLIFGGLSSLRGMEFAFISIGIFLFLFALRGIVRKFHITEKI